MKIVTLEVAKSIKEAGYPQGLEDTAYYNENGVLVKPCVFNGGKEIADAPTYLDVWLWLWREKDMRLSVEYARATNTEYESWTLLNQEHLRDVPVSNGDPEEAIIAAIDYMVEHNLIK